jgi:hypothetical protein
MLVAPKRWLGQSGGRLSLNLAQTRCAAAMPRRAAAGASLGREPLLAVGMQTGQALPQPPYAHPKGDHET